MLSALVRASAACTGVRVIRIPTRIAASIAALIAIGPRAGSLRMVLLVILRMRRLHALRPELPRRVHAASAVKPLRRRRLRAQQQQGREKQPHRQRVEFPAGTHFHFTVVQPSYLDQFFGQFFS
jgi:hypothetical protein